MASPRLLSLLSLAFILVVLSRQTWLTSMLLQIHFSCVTLTSEGLNFLFVIRSVFTQRRNYNRAGITQSPGPSVSSFVS